MEALSSLPLGINVKVVAASDSSDSFNSRAFRDYSVASRFSSLRDENKRLLLERENAKRILHEREEDLKLLRLQSKKQKWIEKVHNSSKDFRDNMDNIGEVKVP